MDLVDGELVGLVDLGDDFEFLLHEFGELELQLLNEVEYVDLFEGGVVAVFVHSA